MNRRRVSTHVFICFLMMMFLMAVGCSSKDDTPPPAAPVTYSIAGTVTGAASVVINLTGAANGTTTTSADYSFTGLANGTYTLTPVLAGYTFNPASKVVVVDGSNMTASFTATLTASSYTISGKVTDVRVSGVKITFSAGSPSATVAEVLTDADGIYTSPSLPATGGPYTVTPYHSGYAFTPANISGITLSNSTGNNIASKSAAFTQADIEGKWSLHELVAGTAAGWRHFTLTIDSDGNLSFADCFSTGSPTCPTGPIVWIIDPTTGVITESGVGGNPNNNYTMASNKNFIAGTLHDIGATYPALWIVQKKVDGTVYANANLQSKNFVFHQLNVGLSNKWQYGTGSTSSTSAINISSQTASDGTPTTVDIGGAIISVDSNGVVTMTGTGMATYNGFLSADKKTIVGTVTEGTEYHMLIIQIIDGQSSATSNIAGTSYGHMLAAGADPAPFWLHRTLSITGGIISFHLSWVSSNSAVTRPTGTQIISIGSSGTATIIGSDFNGQLSYDGKFMVGTETFATGVFALEVITH